MNHIRTPGAIRPGHKIKVFGDSTVYRVERVIRVHDHYFDKRGSQAFTLSVEFHMHPVDGGEMIEYHPDDAEVVELVTTDG